MSDHFKNIEKVQELLQGAQTGLWAIELDEGKPPRMYADRAKTAGSEKNARKADREEAAWGSKTEDQVPPGTLRGQRLMLVEDNELNMEIAKTILEESGMAVDCAGNGEKALQMFVRSEPGTYQAILMDLQMPVMDGIRRPERSGRAAILRRRGSRL